MNRVVLSFMVSMIVCFCLSGVVKGDDPGVLRVQFSRMAPWKLGSCGSERGVDIEFMRLLAERMNLRVEFVHVPFARGLVYMEEGSIDLMTGVLRRDDREGFLHFIDPPYHTISPKAFYVLSEGGPTIETYTDLYGLRIGCIIGAKHFKRFDDDIRLRKDEVRSIHLNFKKLLEGRVDAVIYAETSGDMIVDKLGLEHKVTKAPYKYRRENHVHIVLSKASPLAHRLEEFNRHMRELVESGARETIKDKYAEYIEE